MINLWLLACSPYTVNLPALPVFPEAIVPGQGAIQVDTQALNFSALFTADGLFVTDQLVTIRNSGSANLQILGYAVADVEGPFHLSAPGRTDLAPGDATTLVVSYRPVDLLPHQSMLRIATTDPAHFEIDIPVMGVTLGPALKITHDCPSTPVATGCSQSCSLNIQNTGTSELRIDALHMEGMDLQLAEAPPALPWQIPPGRSQSLALAFSPETAVVDDAVLQLNSNDPVQPHTQLNLPLRSPGFVQQQEEHTIEGGEIDIVVVPKADESMATYLSELETALPTLMGALDGVHADWRLSVLVADDGCVYGPQSYIDPSVPQMDRQQAVGWMIGSATVGSDTSAGLSRAILGLSSEATQVGGCNEGIHRTNYPVAILGVSDAAESSAGGWQKQLLALQKATGLQATIHAFAGDFPRGCNAASPGVGWLEATRNTDGLFQSICEDMGPNMPPLATAMMPDHGTVTLNRLPEADTLQVWVDGLPQEDWRYDAASNSIIFAEGNQPPFNAHVNLAYAESPTCF